MQLPFNYLFLPICTQSVYLISKLEGMASVGGQCLKKGTIHFKVKAFIHAKF